ncbi:helix-turn-helix domain-containing protein [Streptomyces sp. NPDC006624]|uniref:helix-turn-helix domain-containing protein n=1 Tax=Streptomyces sp. NPDC006624 TaxID=3154892 RepID=UPI00339DF34A
MSDETPADLIRTREAARLLGLTPQTIRQWVADGKLNGYRVGRLIKVSRAEVLASAKPIDPDN